MAIALLMMAARHCSATVGVPPARPGSTTLAKEAGPLWVLEPLHQIHPPIQIPNPSIKNSQKKDPPTTVKLGPIPHPLYTVRHSPLPQHCVLAYLAIENAQKHGFIYSQAKKLPQSIVKMFHMKHWFGLLDSNKD